MARTKTPDFEKLGAFYLGRRYDADAGEITGEPILYDAKDLTTHALCVGMTGSGKTGLGIALLEEAAIDMIPALVIDPKGDMGNLLLSFPKLRPQDFRPWIDEAEASRKGQTPDAYAESVANLWREGLAQWGQAPSRIARFRESADLCLYTPGSSAGLPVKALRSFTAPPPAVREDEDAFRERLQSAVAGLLALLGIEADPIRSREHILLSNVLKEAWKHGKDLDLPGLIREIQSPPFNHVGVLDLDTFFPPRERTELAMVVNNLLASPAFAAWMEGEPLDIQRFLWTREGKPRISIFSIAHLSDPERMFFVTLLLNELIAWMRGQPGTSSLRCLLYMDEIFGYFPPTANPPSKTPMLTLLKQARAYGVGVVLASQNPVDLDYKGLSNTGTWFLGRLQTERDKARVLEGLEGASAAAGKGFDRGSMEALLAGLNSRVFLMNNVHEDEPVIFNTRWVLSYLRGPLTRSQIQALMAGRKTAEPPSRTAAEAGGASEPAPPARLRDEAGASERPVVPQQVEEVFLPPSGSLEPGERWLYRPGLLGTADLHYVRARDDVDSWQTRSVLVESQRAPGADPWKQARFLAEAEPEVENAPEPDAAFSDPPRELVQSASYKLWRKRLAGFLYKQATLTLFRCPALKAVSEPGESEGEFRARLLQKLRERRDLEVEKLRRRYAPKLARAQERIRKTEQRIEREQSQYGHQKMQTAISLGATVLGALFGRKLGSVGTVGRATTAMRGMGRAARERSDIQRAREDLAAQKEKLETLDRKLREEIEKITEALDPSRLEVETSSLRPRKSDIAVKRLALCWIPYRVDAEGIAQPAHRLEPGSRP